MPSIPPSINSKIASSIDNLYSKFYLKEPSNPQLCILIKPAKIKSALNMLKLSLSMVDHIVEKWDTMFCSARTLYSNMWTHMTISQDQ